MSSDSGSGANGTTNFIEDWGPDPWALTDPGSIDPGSIDPGSTEPATAEPTFAERSIALAEAGELTTVLTGAY